MSETHACNKLVTSRNTSQRRIVRKERFQLTKTVHHGAGECREPAPTGHSGLDTAGTTSASVLRGWLERTDRSDDNRKSGPDVDGDSDDQLEELRSLVVARLADVSTRRSRIEEVVLSSDDPQRAPSCCCCRRRSSCTRLEHEGVTVWDTLTIGEYLNEIDPTRNSCRPSHTHAHCRSVVTGRCTPVSRRSAPRSRCTRTLASRLPRVVGAQGDIDRVVAIWRECLSAYGGPYLFGDNPTLADAMFAPVCSRFVTYDITLDETCATYVNTIFAMPAMKDWMTAAAAEPDDLEELNAEF